MEQNIPEETRIRALLDGIDGEQGQLEMMEIEIRRRFSNIRKMTKEIWKTLNGEYPYKSSNVQKASRGVSDG